MEFFQLRRVDEAQSLFLEACPKGPLGVEELDLLEAHGRCLAEDVRSAGDLPAFDRSSVDGYAVRAGDTFGASEGLPAYLRVVEEIPMGRAPARRLGPGECARIATGGMLPDGADAVVMIEHTEHLAADEVGVLRAVSPGENVMRRGEDCPAGGVLVPAGRPLRAQELSLLAHAGVLRVRVARRPRVAIVATGDELVDPGEEPGPGQIRESNSFALRALVAEEGGQPVFLGRAPDVRDAVEAKLREALKYDVVLVSGGSSVGARDMTAEIIGGLGRLGILVHGVNLKPGKPTILAVVDGRPVVGLPGHPVSAQVVFALFVSPLLRRLLGLPPFPGHRPAVRARMAKNVASAAGRVDVLRVALEARDGELWAEPVQGKSGLITTLTRADGAVIIREEKEGLLAGEWVDVHPI
ncbi:molybdopterin molybdenumtransferase MoeA [Caldinitratiruptor microaerophilus]|uniref:Molybdopterin molybdenumtransferase n=1 Tax=Caldinitratiruptor microaerophilus TaxID=671077 RepID=A0AA35CMY6_9FIRM|nr:molybdopterin molybdenumtransferase MoeA [Caldinitratiruptor microaerophilus]